MLQPCLGELHFAFVICIVKLIYKCNWTLDVFARARFKAIKILNIKKNTMKKLIMLTLVTAATAGVQAQIISWNENNGGNVLASTGVAGVAAANNWNNSLVGMALIDNSGAASGASFVITGPNNGGTWGPWGIGASPGQDADTTYNRNMLDGYVNSSSGSTPSQLSITGIPYSIYNLIVYISSDTAGRAGTISDSITSTTYDFSTMGPAAISGANALFTQSTDTGGLNPVANYVIFHNVIGSSETLSLNIPVGGGYAGFQIVAVPEPGTLALASLGGLAILALKRRAAKK